MKHLSRSVRDTQERAAAFSKKLAPRKKAIIIALEGDLGAGKTTFVQGMAQGLGLHKTHTVTSPTFTLINEYEHLIHVDLYRIQDTREVLTLGLEEYLVPGNIIAVEWANNWSTDPGFFDYKIQFRERSDEHREIIISHV